MNEHIPCRWVKVIKWKIHSFEIPFGVVERLTDDRRRPPTTAQHDHYNKPPTPNRLIEHQCFHNSVSCYDL